MPPAVAAGSNHLGFLAPPTPLPSQTGEWMREEGVGGRVGPVFWPLVCCWGVVGGGGVGMVTNGHREHLKKPKKPKHTLMTMLMKGSEASSSSSAADRQH